MTEPEAPQFQHKPFGDDRSQIRLVQVLADLTSDGLIQLSIGAYPFRPRRSPGTPDGPDARPPYSCLSYTWGDALVSHAICINGSRFLVRHNLWRFLVALRKQYNDHGGLRHHKDAYYGVPDTYDLRPSCESYFWIDALCIDQGNHAERGHQVQRMGDIYKGAHLVLIWLSLGSNDESVLQQIHLKHGSVLENNLLVRELVYADYWSRAWITQEILLAREPVFSMESGLYDYVSIRNMLTDSGFHYTTANFTDLADLHRHWNSMGRRIHDASRDDLLTMLWKLSEARNQKQCANVLDRIYSVLSLCHDGSRIDVDYNFHPAELVVHILVTYKEDFCVCLFAMLAYLLQLDCFTHPILDNTCVTVKAPASSSKFENGQWICEACGCAMRGLWEGPWSQDHAILCFRRNMCESSFTHLVAIQPNDPCKPCQIFRSGNLVGEMSGVSIAHESKSHGRWRLSISCLLHILLSEEKLTWCCPLRRCNRARQGSVTALQTDHVELELDQV